MDPQEATKKLLELSSERCVLFEDYLISEIKKEAKLRGISLNKAMTLLIMGKICTHLKPIMDKLVKINEEEALLLAAVPEHAMMGIASAIAMKHPKGFEFLLKVQSSALDESP